MTKQNIYKINISIGFKRNYTKTNTLGNIKKVVGFIRI